MNDQQLQLKSSLVQGLLNYLYTRPFGEVEGLIQAIKVQVAPQVKQEAAQAPVQE